MRYRLTSVQRNWPSPDKTRQTAGDRTRSDGRSALAGPALAGPALATAGGGRIDEQVEHLADRRLTRRALAQWLVGLHLVAVAPPLPLLDDVAGLGQVGNDAVS